MPGDERTMNENNLTGKRAALYIRVSTEEQARHGLSLDEQEHELTDYAIEHGAVVVGIYRDEGTTARKNLKRRKELQRLLSDVKANEIDVILFIKLDRWFRNIADYYKVQEILDAHGVDWVAIRESYNTTSSNGRLMLNIRLSVAQNESDQTSERIKFIFEGKKRRKEALGGRLPLGYTVGKNKQIVIDDEKADIVRDLFQYFLDNRFVLRVAQYARNEYGLHYTYQAVKAMLRNDCYIGTFYGIKNYASAIIDSTTWEKVQELASRYQTKTPSKAKMNYLFSGLIVCPSCQHLLVGHSMINKHAGTRTPYYLCSYRYTQEKGYCNFSGTIFEHPLEKHLLKHIGELIKTYQEGNDLEKQYQEDMERRNTKQHSKNIKRVKELKESLNRLKDLYVGGFIDRDTYRKDFKKYNEQLQAVLHNRQPPKRISKATEQVLENGVPAIYWQLSREQRKKFWHAIVKEIHITHYERGRDGKKKYFVVFI